MHVMCTAVTVHAICEGLDTIVGWNGVNVLVNNAQFIVLVIIFSSLEVGGQI